MECRPASQPARDTIGMYVSGRRGSLEPTIDRKRQLYRKFVDYYSKASLELINRFTRIEHVHLTGRSTRALKEPTHEMRQVRPCYKQLLYFPNGQQVLCLCTVHSLKHVTSIEEDTVQTQSANTNTSSLFAAASQHPLNFGSF